VRGVGRRLRLTFSDATQDDAEAISALHADAAENLTARFGHGHWSRPEVVRRIDPPSPFVRLRVGRKRGRLVCALRLQTKKPWAIDVSYFTAVQRPLYLTGMVVALTQQGSGVGRAALVDAHEIAQAWPADAIRLDAYDSAAGAGPFYARCGYAERGRVAYKGNPLVYYEFVLQP
jgi:GNAT superfamily N-acetyltransferase